MSFEAFTTDDIRKILDHTLENMSKEALTEQIQKYGSEEKYREYLSSGFQNEQAIADILKWYGGKDKAMEAVMSSTGSPAESGDTNDEIYRQFMLAKDTADFALEKDAVEKLASRYRELFRLDNARAILLDLAKEYLEMDKLAEQTDRQYGNGCAEYVGKAIRRYYGA